MFFPGKRSERSYFLTIKFSPPPCLSDILSSFKEELRKEIIEFPDIKAKHLKRTTLVTVADLEKVIETQIRERNWWF